MTPTVSDIVDELIDQDPSLAGDRAQLTAVVQTMLDNQPSADMRPEFQRELLLRLREKMNLGETASSYFSFPQFLMQSKLLFTGMGTLIGAIAVLAVTSMQSPVVPQQQPSVAEQAADSDAAVPPATDMVAINDVSPSAFGPLGTAAGGADMEQMADSRVANPRPQSGGGGLGGGGAGVAANYDAKMIAPYPPDGGEYYQTEYVYSGDIALPTDSVNVYQRSSDNRLPAGSSSVTGFARDLLNWSALGALQLQNASIKTSGGTEYNIYIDYPSASISLNRMYTAAEHPNEHCNEADCWERNRLKETDMIADEQAISIARSFAQSMGISLDSFGEPEITDSWRIMYARTDDKSNYYFPEVMNVVFPLLIDGVPVYEEYGQAYGLNISIDVRTKTVSGLYNLNAYSFDRSQYAAVTDEATVREAIARGGANYWTDPNAKKSEAQLGEPESILMHMYRWNEGDRNSYELYVPALRFEITEPAENTYDSRQAVVVPLTAELYEEKPDRVVPMPLAEPLMEVQE